MTEALWGVVIGGVIGIFGSLISIVLAARNESRRRKRDHEIGQIATTVRVLDQWERLAMSKLTGDKQQFAAADAALRALDDQWDWSPDVIPGNSGRELLGLATGIYTGQFLSDKSDPFGYSTKLTDLQTEMRTSASRRTRDLQ